MPTWSKESQPNPVLTSRNMIQLEDKWKWWLINIENEWKNEWGRHCNTRRGLGVFLRGVLWLETQAIRSSSSSLWWVQLSLWGLLLKILGIIRGWRGRYLIWGRVEDSRVFCEYRLMLIPPCHPSVSAASALDFILFYIWRLLRRK